jgi:hypothetical protein
MGTCKFLPGLALNWDLLISASWVTRIASMSLEVAHVCVYHEVLLSSKLDSRDVF